MNIKLPAYLLSTTALITFLSFSPSAFAQAEEEITGTLEIIHIDKPASKKSENHYYLKEDNGDPSDNKARKFKINFKKSPNIPLKTGQIIKVRGTTSAGANNVLALNTSGSTGTITTVTAAAAVTGVQNTIALLVSFPDSAQTCTQASMENVLFTGAVSVNKMYQESSYGNISFAGNVVPLTITNTSTTCDYYKWATDAENAAVAAGVNLSAYNRRLILVPPSTLTLCPGWAGVSNVGGNPSRSWVFGKYACGYYGRVSMHELAMH